MKAVCELSLESKWQTRLLFVQGNSFSKHPQTLLSIKSAAVQVEFPHDYLCLKYKCRREISSNLGQTSATFYAGY